MVNAALFIFSPKVLEQIEVGTKSHIEKHVLPALFGQRDELVRIRVFLNTSRIWVLLIVIIPYVMM